MAYYPRSSWTSIPKGGTVLAGSGRTMTAIYIHYPGQAASIGTASVASTRNRLAGYRRQHKNVNGWADIAYNLAVDQSGNVWELRGIGRQSGANGGTTSNRHGQAILVLVGNNETPTAECIAGIQDAVRRVRAAHPQARTIRGHQQSPDASTACPGASLMRLVRSGGLEPGTASAPAVPAGGASVPAPKPASKPAVKDDGKLVVDGRLGTATVKSLQKLLGVKADGRACADTWKALQRLLGTPQDGAVSHQSYRATELGNGIVPRCWRFTGRGSKGSKMVVALQKRLGVTADGVWFEGTTRALQLALNDGKL